MTYGLVTTPKENRTMEKAKEDFRSLVISTEASYGSYHHHKETMAWAATALYVGGLLGLAAFEIDGLTGAAARTVITVLTAIMAVLFINAQFSDRAEAASIIAACNMLVTRLTAPEFQLTKRHAKPQAV